MSPYRIDFTNRDFYLDYHQNELQALITAMDTNPRFELDNPDEDVINVTKCSFLHRDKKRAEL